MCRMPKMPEMPALPGLRRARFPAIVALASAYSTILSMLVRTACWPPCLTMARSS